MESFLMPRRLVLTIALGWGAAFGPLGCGGDGGRADTAVVHPEPGTPEPAEPGAAKTPLSGSDAAPAKGESPAVAEKSAQP